MNSVELVGRLTRDPETRGKCTSFTLAIDRPVKQGEEKQTDFPRVICFGKDFVQEKYKKGMLVEVIGKIQTGSYQGKYGTVYTTDVKAESLQVLDWNKTQPKPEPKAEPMQMDFAAVDEDVPF